MPSAVFDQKNVSYLKLAPFREVFEEGLPILVYHKVGPRPRGLKLKSIQMPEKVFQRQIAELTEAGFQTITLDEWKSFSIPHSRKVIITFDDGSRGVLRNAEKHMAKSGFKAIQYIVANHIGDINQWDVDNGEAKDALMDKEEIRDWLARGHQIGSHTLTHPKLAKTAADKARMEIFDSKKKLEDTFGIPIRHFCYPYGSYNAAARDFVGEAGYETAVTLKPGVNQPDALPLELLRIGTRHPTRNFRAVVKRFLGLEGK
ncbi:MAG: polysaccharide deacetylase family protein [Chthoniobacterales bacterium]